MIQNTRSQENTELQFHSAEHKVLGMEGPMVEALRDNAPKAVGGLRLTSILMASVAHPMLAAHGFFVFASEAVLLLFGSKKSVEKYKGYEDENESLNPLSKAIRPHKYPLESSSALDIIGEVPHFILGASMVYGLDLGETTKDFLEWFLGEEIHETADGTHAGHNHDGHDHGPNDHTTADKNSCGPDQQRVEHGDHFDCIDTNINAAPIEPDPWDMDYDEKYEQWEKEYAQWEAETAAAEAAATQAAGQAACDSAAKDCASAEKDCEEDGHNHLTGAALMVHGALGVLGHLPLLLFGPEKDGKKTEHFDAVGDDIGQEHQIESLEFSQAESKVVGTQDKGILQWFKDHQVAISSTLQVAIGVTMIVATGMPDIYQWAGVPLVAAGVMQALLVNKKDFSADAPAEDTHHHHHEETKNNVHSPIHYGNLAHYEQERNLGFT